VDILLASNNSPEGNDPDLFLRMLEALIKGVEKRRISKAMIETSHARIMELKKRIS
jgi:hypothetical protein